MTLNEHLSQIAFTRRWLNERGDRFMLAGTADDIQEARTSGRLAIAFDVEGMAPIGHDPDLVEPLYALGVRWMLVAYNLPNEAGGGCMDVDPGLSKRGLEIIAEMNRVGMVVCCSHTGKRTALDTIHASSDPVIFSHSNPSGHYPHVRNIDDELMAACARRGGVIGLNGLGPFLGTNGDVVHELANHILYAVEKIGAEHIGLGLDYVFDTEELEAHARANPHLFPPGAEANVRMVAPEDLERLTDRLLAAGLGEADIKAILGGNWLRIARTVWK
jgi:membrane dipeptidase